MSSQCEDDVFGGEQFLGDPGIWAPAQLGTLGPGRSKLSYAIGAGVTYKMDDQFSIRFLCDGEFQTDYQEHSITAAIRFQF